MIGIGIAAIVLLHVLVPLPFSVHLSLIVDGDLIIIVLEVGVLGVVRRSDLRDPASMLLFDKVALSCGGKAAENSCSRDKF